IRGPLQAHIAQLHSRFLDRGWGGRVGFGKKPALIVIDLAIFWTQPTTQIGSDLESVIQNSLSVLAAARSAGIPVFFTSYALDPSDPPSPQNKKLRLAEGAQDPAMYELDPRLQRRPTEKLVRKRYASAFKGTNLHEMLTSLSIDTLIVTGVSTSHCVYATCRYATDSFRVIVPKEAVGERCELLHEVNLLDIDLDLGDVMPVAEVIQRLRPKP
ncbi:MAG: isochorismatase family protein, partial [Pirellulaceae bacterium]|nr:isochorismatase family protein [Pirellulaceae bacterium]